MSRSRQQNQSAEMRDRILTIARRILSEEGAAALSIRRITAEMDYSPAIVYHYFRNKDEILHCLLAEGYQRILASIRPPGEGLAPPDAIRSAMEGYLLAALGSPKEYREVMFSSRAEFLTATSVLDADARNKREAMSWLIAQVESGVSQGYFAPCDPVLTAQALWCALFGLISRIIIEGVPENARRSALIECQIDLLLKGLRT